MKIMRAAEDYLEAMLMMKGEARLYPFHRRGGLFGCDEAERLLCNKAPRESGYITMDKDGLITLNDSGLQIASSMLDRHHMLTRFLVTLGVDRKTAEEDALPHGARHQPTDLRGHLRPCCEIPAAAEGTRGSGRRKNKPRFCDEMTKRKMLANSQLVCYTQLTRNIAKSGRLRRTET